MHRPSISHGACAALLAALVLSATPARAQEAAQRMPATAAEAGTEAAEGTPSRIAFGSCMHQDRSQDIWARVIDANPQVFIFLGDNIYGDTEDMKILSAKYAQLASKAGFQQIRDTAETFATWDDHDFGANDVGNEYPMKVESQAIFREFWGHEGYGGDEGVYSFHQRGDVQIICLDTRYFRDKIEEPDGPDKELLGAAQWAWLEDILANKPARLRIIASSIQFVSDQHRWEKWGRNFEHERQRFLGLVKKYQVGGIVFISGDRHLADLSAFDFGVGYPILDVTSSGMAVTRREGEWRPSEPNDYRIAGYFFGDNFGYIEVDWTVADPVIDLQIRDIDGRPRVWHRTTLSKLQPGSYVPRDGY